MDMFRNAMVLYRPSLSVWTARKRDKDESEKVNTAAGAVAGAANVHKALLPDSAELQAVQKWATSFRTWVYASTLPWDDNGGRVARVERHMDFMQEVGDRMRQGDELVNAFMDSYVAAIEEAKFKLNGMFKPLDYPSLAEVRCKFHFELECAPVPAAADFRIVEGLPSEEVERLVGEAEARSEAKVRAAMDEAYDRLLASVMRMAETLSQYSSKEIKKFNDSLVSNIKAVIELMPALNLTNDPRLMRLAEEAAHLCNYAPSELRKDDKVRAAAIREAKSVVAMFKHVQHTEQQAGGGGVVMETQYPALPPAAPIPAGIMDGW